MVEKKVSEIAKEYEQLFNQSLEVQGRVRSIRDSKTFGFIEFNDGSCFRNLQIVFEDHLENFEEITKIPTGSSIIVEGILVPSEWAKQAYELKASAVQIVGIADETFPLQKKKHSFEYLRTIAHLRFRTNTFNAVFRVRNLLSFAVHSFFQERGFIWAHTPLITASDCEGAGETFQVTTLDMENLPKNEDGTVDYSQDFFSSKASLTVSGQLQGEAFSMGYRNIYTFGPTFRAENSNTSRHLAEFRMIEPEMSFVDLEGNMQIAEDLIKYVFSYVLEKAPDEMNFFDQFIMPGVKERAEKLVKSDFTRITYTEAIELLKNCGEKFENAPVRGDELYTEHERYLAEKIFKGPVFVTDYPKDIKAFYMKLNEDGKTVRAMDMLVPGVGEMIGGSQREESYEKIVARMQELGMKIEDYSWYLDLRKYGSVPHSGFGVGFERLVMYITGMENIRDVIAFPRYPRNCAF